MADSNEPLKQFIMSEIQLLPKIVLESHLLRLQSDLVGNFLIVYGLNVQIQTETLECKIEQDSFLRLQERWIKLDHSAPSSLSQVPLYKMIYEKYEGVKAVIETFNEKFKPYLRVLQSCFEGIVQAQLTEQDTNKMSPDLLKCAMKLLEVSLRAVAELKSQFLGFKQEWNKIKMKVHVDIQDCNQRITTLLKTLPRRQTSTVL